MSTVRMAMVRLAVIIAAALAWPGAACASTAKVAHELDAGDVEAWLSGVLNYGLDSGDIAGAVVSVVKDGRVLFQSGYGYADVAKKTPMDAEKTLTRIGSTSKLFTWTAVMQLVGQGKLDLDRNVDDYLDFKVSPAHGKPITLLDLMNHRGGFEEGLKDLLSMNPQGLQSTETYLKGHPRPLLFPAGSVPAYSNYGAALAGYIVQRVSGEPFERYIENHIFRPLGMLQSTFEQPIPERFHQALAIGYRSASQPPQPIELVVTRPAGSVASTAADMARFMLAHLGNGRTGDAEILRPETAELMHTPSQASLPNFAVLAHGFFHEIRNGRTLIGHGGDTVFFHSELDLLPNEGVGIFYSFNSRGRDNAVYELRKALLDQFMDRYFPAAPASSEPAAVPSAATDAARIAGRYESSRRVEHGFLSLFYLLQQPVIHAGPDGTVEAPGTFEPGEIRFREIAPDLWQQVGGAHELALRYVNGVKTVIDSEDPTSVLQAVPLRRSASLNLPVLLASVAILATCVILWPIAALVRRHYGRPVASELRRPRLWLRLAAAFDVVWLGAWMLVLLPALSVQLDVYGTRLDPVIRTLQFGGVAAVVLAGLGVYGALRLWAAPASWPSRVGHAAIAAALLGVVWIGFMGGLIGFDLNY